MKAIVYREYGSADMLCLEDIPKPVPKDDEVLVKVRAASLNPLDWRMMHGKPRVLRLIAKLMKLSGGRIGVDVAGSVEATGAKVTQFSAGDEVFGGARGACAEYVCTRERRIVKKPKSVTFEEAASINVAGLTALQGLRDKGKLQAGDRILINGASGGVGTFAVQIAKAFGAHVTGVCSTRNVELVKSIGADASIDYTQEDFTERPERYDLILECAGNKELSACQRVLNPKGRCVLVGAPHEISVLELMMSPLKAMSASFFSDRKIKMFVARTSQKDLAFLADLIATSKLKPVVERKYTLSETAEAIRHLEEGHARGKIIVGLMAED